MTPELKVIAEAKWHFGTIVPTVIFPILWWGSRWFLPGVAVLAAGVMAFQLRVRERLYKGMQKELAGAVQARTRELDEHLTELERSEARKGAMLESAWDAIVSVDEGGNIIEFNPAAEKAFRYSYDEAIGKDFLDLIAPESRTGLRVRHGKREARSHTPSTPPTDPDAGGQSLQQRGSETPQTRSEICAVRAGGETFPTEMAISRVRCKGEAIFVAFFRDLTELKRKNQELLKAQEAAVAADQARIQAQKLESIGQLAAGIAHEINTPIQYVGDNLQFLQNTFRDLLKCSDASDRFVAEVEEKFPDSAALGVLKSARLSADLEYVKVEAPLAIAQSIEGASRVASIVRAMKEFSHPGSASKSLTDINNAIRNTIIVSKNEWKYVSEVVEDLDPALPLVPCIAGEFNQAILNLVVNAAHAIGDVIRDKSGAKGTITLRTRQEKDWARIEVRDTGTGIAEWCRPHVFNLFFTTKDVGRGTGQGLSFAYNAITQKHSGELFFETEVGVGTTFVIRLPLNVTEEQPT
jgi:signal transduction histidine kinase